MTKIGTLVGLCVVLSSCNKSWSPNEYGPQIRDEHAKLEAVPGGAPKADGECNCRDKGEPSRAEAVDTTGLELTRAPAKGPADARVTMIAFCDFECPFCKRVQKTLSELETTYGSELRIVAKQLPLPFHTHARAAAKAALAAQDQGKYWELHPLLMTTRTELDDPEIERLAGVAGLDMRRFHSTLAEPELEERLERELADADRVGARGTPSFVINGKKLVGAQPYETFANLIDEALAQAK